MTLFPPDKARILAYQRETVRWLHSMEAKHYPELVPPEELRLILDRIHNSLTMIRLAEEGFCLNCRLPWEGHSQGADGNRICISLAEVKA